MNKRAVWFLLALMVTAVAVIDMRHSARVLYAQLEQLRAERDALDIEWGKLLLEEGAFAQHQRVEELARARLGMRAPAAEDIVVVEVESGGR